jgi:hypothetical protein
MKKRLLKYIGLAVIVVAAGITIIQEKKSSAMSDMTLANVEALANGEGTGDCIIANCRWQSGSYCDYTCNGVSFSSSNMYNK